MSYNANGSISIVGRKDNQVKLRGMRIELGEIEYQIQKSFSRALEVVVERIIPPEKARPHFLAAFVSQRGSGEEESSEVEGSGLFVDVSKSFLAAVCEARAALLDVVPAYMIPSLFIPVSASLRTLGP